MSLTFTPKISRLANLYFFIQNLSEWHLSNRKEYNKIWRSQLTFSTEAESCIQEFKKIHGQYPFGDKYLGRSFFLYDNPWSEIELLIGKNNTIDVKRIFTTLEPYFNTLYTEEEILLKKWETVISKPEFLTSAFYINNTLASFYGCMPYDEQCTIYLLLSTTKKNGGTAGTVSDHAITLELSRIPIESEKQILNILWHELIHLYFRNHKLYPLLKEGMDCNWEIMGKIDEFVASSLLPNGLLSKHSLATIDESIIPENLNARIASEKILHVQRLIYPYLQQKKAIDLRLVKELCLIFDVNKKRE